MILRSFCSSNNNNNKIKNLVSPHRLIIGIFKAKEMTYKNRSEAKMYSNLFRLSLAYMGVVYAVDCFLLTEP